MPNTPWTNWGRHLPSEEPAEQEAQAVEALDAGPSAACLAAIDDITQMHLGQPGGTIHYPYADSEELIEEIRANLDPAILKRLAFQSNPRGSLG